MIKQIKAKFMKLLNFLRLTDENGLFSITNIMVWIFVFKFAYAPMETIQTNDMILALSSMGVYMGKKVIGTVKERVITEVKELPSELMEKLKDGNA